MLASCGAWLRVPQRITLGHFSDRFQDFAFIVMSIEVPTTILSSIEDKDLLAC